MYKSYEKLKNDIQNLIGVRIEQHTIIDQILYGVGKAIDKIKEEIELSKNPHIYSGLKGKQLDELGLLVGCPRFENESESSYFTRIMNHHTANKTCNTTSILFAISNLKYSSHASYVPFTQGVATSTIHFIPKNYNAVQEAVEEIEKRLADIKAPDSFFVIEPAKPVAVEVVCYLVTKNDLAQIKNNLESRLKSHINNIPIGETLSYKNINMLGLSTDGVNFFNTVTIFIDGKPLHAIEKVQTIKEKFIFSKMHLEVANN